MALYGKRLLVHPSASRRTVDPAVEPVKLAALKDHLRITHSDDDMYLTDLLAEARIVIEDATGLAFITQTWKMTLDGWPTGPTEWWNGMRQGAIGDLHGSGGPQNGLELRRFPLQSVTSVTTYDEADASTVVSVADTFHVDTQNYPGKLTLRAGSTWPVAMRESNAIEIVYVAGFGDAATDVPAPAARSIIVLAGYMYAHRGDGCTPTQALRLSGALELLAGYIEVHI